MLDWRVLVQQRLAGLALDSAEKEEIYAELSAHLEESYEVSRTQGISEQEAIRRTLSQVANWQDLQRKILTAKRREYPMQKRIHQLWIPGFLTLILSMIFLAVVRKLGFQTPIIWSAPKPILLYVPWLLSLPPLGALGAYLSSRAGGSRGTMVLVTVFPVLALTAAFLLMFPIGSIIEMVLGHHTDFSLVAPVLLKDGIGWLVLPGAALLMGGLLAQLLFSRGSSSHGTVSVRVASN